MNINSAATPNSGLANAYEQKTPLTARLFFWALTSSLAGFIFGFDTVVISGAEEAIQKVWHLSSGQHGFLLGAALYGTIIGSLGGGWPTDKLGRRLTLILLGVLFIISAIGCAFAPSPAIFIVARFIGGLGIGVSTVAAPLYISEISPARQRGFLTALFQFNIVFGIIIAQVSNLALNNHGDNSWRYMLGVAAIPSFIYLLMCFGLPESPRWLLTRKGDRAGGLRVLGLISPQASAPELDAEANAITEAARADASQDAAGFFSWRLRKPIMIAFLVAFFNQLSGINAVLYFAPRILKMTGHFTEHAALQQNIGLGVTNLIFTFVGLALIDRLGRKTLLILGSLGYITSLGLCAWSFFGQHFTYLTYFLFAFIASHAVGQGTVIWVLISEIFPNRFRAAGTALGCGTHWVFAALVTTLFPIAVARLGIDEQHSYNGGYIFAFFCGMMVLQLLWAIIQVPETKGVPLDDIQRKLGIAEA